MADFNDFVHVITYLWRFQIGWKPSRLSIYFPGCAETFQILRKLSSLSGNFPNCLETFQTYNMFDLILGQFCRYAQKLSGRRCRHTDGVFLPLAKWSWAPNVWKKKLKRHGLAPNLIWNKKMIWALLSVFSDDADKFGRVMIGLKCDAEKVTWAWLLIFVNDADIF